MQLSQLYTDKDSMAKRLLDFWYNITPLETIRGGKISIKFDLIRYSFRFNPKNP